MTSNEANNPGDLIPVQAKHPSDVIGNWGPVQRRIVYFLAFVYIIAAFNNLTIPFYAPKLDFHCNYINKTTGLVIQEKNKCTYQENNVTIKCSNFTYDNSFFERTLVDEFDLVCDKSWYPSFAQSCHQMGYAVSGLLLGFLSDRYGRLFSARIAIALEIFAGFGQALAPSMYFFWFSRFFVGLAAYGRFLTGYVLVTEWIGPKARSQAVCVYEYGYLIGYMNLAWIYYLVPNYKKMQFSVSTIEIFLFVAYILVVWESPRWLLTHSKYDQADKLLRKAAKAKGKLTEDEINVRMESLKVNAVKEFEAESSVQQQTVLDVWKVPSLLKLSLILYYTWFAQGFIGYASIFNVGNLGGSIFISFFAFACSSLLTNTLLIVFINKLPRKQMMIITMAIEAAGLFGLLCCSFNMDLYLWRVFFSFIYNAARSATVKVYYLYTAETFPTTMRQASIGTCSIFARIGSVIAPFMKELTNYTHLSVCIGIFLSLCSVNLILIFLVPETGKIQLPDTIGQKKKHIELKQVTA